MLAGRLQRCTTTLAARMEDAVRVRHHLQPAPGAGAAPCRGLRASSRRYHRPTGQSQLPERTQDWIKLGGKVTTSIAVLAQKPIAPSIKTPANNSGLRKDRAACRMVAPSPGSA